MRFLQKQEEVLVTLQGQMKELKETVQQLSLQMVELPKKTSEKVHDESWLPSSYPTVKKKLLECVSVTFRHRKWFDDEKSQGLINKILERNQLKPDVKLNTDMLHVLKNHYSTLRKEFALWVRTAGLKILLPSVDVSLFPKYRMDNVADHETVTAWKAHLESQEEYERLEEVVKAALDMLRSTESKQYDFTSSNVGFAAMVLYYTKEGHHIHPVFGKEKYSEYKKLAMTEMATLKQTLGSNLVEMSPARSSQSETSESPNKLKKTKRWPQSEKQRERAKEGKKKLKLTPDDDTTEGGE